MPDPRYQLIADEIRGRIESGALAPGERVPSTRQIARDWQVAMATATKVLTTLRQQDLVEARPGIGTVVRALHAKKPRKADPTALSKDTIVTAAITMADAEGLAALSMRRVAAAMDVGAMTLYHYVPSKEELVRLMAEAVFAVESLPDPAPAGWRARLETVARLHWRTYGRHPWVAAPAMTSLARPPVLPSAMAQVEWQLAGLDNLGLTHLEMLRAVGSLNGFVGGVALGRGMELEIEQNSGITSEKRWAAYDSLAREVISNGNFPTLSKMRIGRGESADLAALFEFGLQRHLDGFAAFIDRARQHPPPRR
ncbi:TetR/AcrR family transcriptional regulator C-terminal domain-containing protein [Fodinicola feengrottensis]